MAILSYSGRGGGDSGSGRHSNMVGRHGGGGRGRGRGWNYGSYSNGYDSRGGGRGGGGRGGGGRWAGGGRGRGGRWIRGGGGGGRSGFDGRGRSYGMPSNKWTLSSDSLSSRNTKKWVRPKNDDQKIKTESEDSANMTEFEQQPNDTSAKVDPSSSSLKLDEEELDQSQSSSIRSLQEETPSLDSLNNNTTDEKTSISTTKQEERTGKVETTTLDSSAEEAGNRGTTKSSKVVVTNEKDNSRSTTTSIDDSIPKNNNNNNKQYNIMKKHGRNQLILVTTASTKTSVQSDDKTTRNMQKLGQYKLNRKANAVKDNKLKSSHSSSDVNIKSNKSQTMDATTTTDTTPANEEIDKSVSTTKDESLRNTSNTNSNNSQQRTMHKRGRNQLVLGGTKTVSHPSVQATADQSENSLQRHGRFKLDRRSKQQVTGGKTFERDNKEIQTLTTKKTSSSNDAMKKFGKNKLVLSSNKESTAKSKGVVERHQNKGKTDEQQQYPASFRTQDEQLGVKHQGVSLRKVGSNKLVLPSSPKKGGIQPVFNPQPYHTGIQQKKRRHQLSANQSSGFHKSDRSAKRIKVAITVTNSNDETEATRDGDQDELDNKGATTKTSSTESTTTTTTTIEKLTDFAYRGTRMVKQRGGGCSKKWDAKSGKSNTSLKGPARSMGLVRVQPDKFNTPICPIFLKGVECTDKYCTKRHDVPKESAMPICSFFQRHGQCLKAENCIFRHIKVNRRAVICPSFDLLGFCEDKNCLMKHVRKNNNNNNNNMKRSIYNKNKNVTQKKLN